MTERLLPILQVLNKDFEGKCDNCGVCCTHVSINSSLPNGTQFLKEAGETCQYLTEDNMCSIWGDEQKQPAVCRDIKPLNSLCRFDLRGETNGTALHIQYLQELEAVTSPTEQTQ